MRKIFLLVLVMAMVIPAYADTTLHTIHSSVTDIDGGHADLTGARFYALWMSLADDNVTPLPSILGTSGQMTLTGASYSLWDGSTKLNITPENSRTFTLKADSPDTAGGYTEYMPDGNTAFLDSADSGMKGAKVSWSLPSAPFSRSRAEIPEYLTTHEQLKAYVPYFECISSGDVYTGMSWRIVSPDNTSLSLPLSEDIMLNVSAYRRGNNNFYSGSWFKVDAGDEPEGTVSFADPVASSDLWLVIVNFCKSVDDPMIYQWRYVRPPATEPELRITYNSSALLSNGKSDFNTAKTQGVTMELYGGDTLAESKYLTDAGTLTIEGTGGSPDIEVKLKPVSSLELGSSYIDYKPADESGNAINFSEDIVNGKNILWKLSGINGSANIPAFKSFTRQFAEGVPYVELVRDGSKVTGIIFRLVSAYDTSEQVSPRVRTDFYLRTYNPSGKDYVSGWKNNMVAGTWNFDEPVSVDDLKGIVAKVRTWDDAENPCVYQWDFGYSYKILEDMQEDMNEFGEAVLEAGEALTESITGLGDAISELAQAVEDTVETALVIALIALVLGIIILGVAGAKGCDTGTGIIGLAVLILFILIRRKLRAKA